MGSDFCEGNPGVQRGNLKTRKSFSPVMNVNALSVEEDSFLWQMKFTNEMMGSSKLSPRL